MSRANAAQLAMVCDGTLLAETALDRVAQRHASRHGLTWVRCEMHAGLFAQVEVAVFRAQGGAEIRRTREMIAQAAGTGTA